MLSAKRIGSQIKRFRELAGLSKSELARRVGVSPTAVNNWEDNGVIPRLEMMVKLSEVLEVNLMQLRGARMHEHPEAESPHAAPSASDPEVSRGDRLDQFRRQIAALFEVTPNRVDIIIRT